MLVVTPLGCRHGYPRLCPTTATGALRRWYMEDMEPAGWLGTLGDIVAGTDHGPGLRHDAWCPLRGWMVSTSGDKSGRSRGLCRARLALFSLSDRACPPHRGFREADGFALHQHWQNGEFLIQRLGKAQMLAGGIYPRQGLWAGRGSFPPGITLQAREGGAPCYGPGCRGLLDALGCCHQGAGC